MRTPGFSLGPRKWEMADEAETGSVQLLFAGSDLFFISSRFAEIYENVFLIPRAHANCWRGGGGPLEQSEGWPGARRFSALAVSLLLGPQARPCSLSFPDCATPGFG